MLLIFYSLRSKRATVGQKRPALRPMGPDVGAGPCHWQRSGADMEGKLVSEGKAWPGSNLTLVNILIAPQIYQRSSNISGLLVP